MWLLLPPEIAPGLEGRAGHGRSGRSRGHLVGRRPRRRERPVLPSGSWGTPRYRERLPQRGVTQGGRETFGEKGLSGLQAGRGALKVRALFGIVQDGGIAVTDPPQDGDDRVHIIGHLPADGITTPFCISLRSTAAVRRTSLSAGNTNGDTMILARCCLVYSLDPHFDLSSSRKIVFVEKPWDGTRTTTVARQRRRPRRSSVRRYRQCRNRGHGCESGADDRHPTP